MSTTRWDPAGNAVHRLLQLLDILFITENRSRQLLGFNPLAGSAVSSSNPPDTPEWWNLREEVNCNTRWVMCSAFREEAIHAHSALEQLAYDGIAHLRAEAVPASDLLVEDAAQLLLDCIHARFGAPGDPAPRLFDSRLVEWGDGPEFDPESAPDVWVDLTDRYSRLRAQLFRCLASAGQTVDVEIHRRADLAVYRLPPEWEKPEKVEQLVQWSLDTLSPRELLDALIDVGESIWAQRRNALHFMRNNTDDRMLSPLDGTLSNAKETGLYFGGAQRWWKRHLMLLCQRLAPISVEHLSTHDWAQILRSVEEVFDEAAQGIWSDDPKSWLDVGAEQIKSLRALRERVLTKLSPTGGQGDHTPSGNGPGKPEDERSPRPETAMKEGTASLRHLNGDEMVQIMIALVGNWEWPSETGGHHDLDLFLDLADRICTCVSAVANCKATNPPLDHPGGAFLNERLDQSRHTVLAINTHPHASLREWKGMIEALAMTLEKGLRLTYDDDCESWRKTYLSQVSLVRSVRTRLSPVEPYTPTTDPGSIQFFEQRGTFHTTSKVSAAVELPPPEKDGLRRRLSKAEREPHVREALRKLAGFDVTSRTWPQKYHDKIRAVRVEELAKAAKLPPSSAATTDTWEEFERRRKRLDLSPTSVQGSKTPLNLSDTRLKGYEGRSTDNVVENADRNEIHELASQGELPDEDLWERLLEKSTAEQRSVLEQMRPAERQEVIEVFRQQLNDQQ